MLSSITKYPIGWLPTIGASGLPVHPEKTFLRAEDDYVAARQGAAHPLHTMSCLCEKLYMTYFGKLPRPYELLHHQSLVDLWGKR